MELNNYQTKNIVTLVDVTINLRCVFCKKEIEDHNFIIVFHRIKNTNKFEDLSNHVAHLRCYHKAIYETKWTTNDKPSC